MKCTSSNVVFEWNQDRKLKSGEIELVQEVKKDLRWAKAVVTGPDSKISPGDALLLSARVTTYTFEHLGKTLHNTSDDSTLAYRHKGILYATTDHMLIEWLDPIEEVTESGIVVVRKDINKEVIVKKALVHCAGPDTGVQAGDVILAAYNKDSYEIEIDGKILRNADKNAVICYFRE
jgi:hypothetical protein